MDPQKLASLDPKLREAYQRVMGTPLPQVQPASPRGEPVQPPTPSQPPVSEPEPAIPQQPPLGANNFVQMNSEVASAPTAAPPASPNFVAPATASTIAVKKKSMMMPVMIGAAALVFLAIYTLFWTKLFSLKVPFLP